MGFCGLVSLKHPFARYSLTRTTLEVSPGPHWTAFVQNPRPRADRPTHMPLPNQIEWQDIKIQVTLSSGEIRIYPIELLNPLEEALLARWIHERRQGDRK